MWTDDMTASVPINSSCNSSFTCNIVFPEEACLVFYFCVWADWCVVSGVLSLAHEECWGGTDRTSTLGGKEMATALAWASCLSSANVLPLVKGHFFPPTLVLMETEGKQNRYVPGLYTIVSFPDLVNVSLIGLVTPSHLSALQEWLFEESHVQRFSWHLVTLGSAVSKIWLMSLVTFPWVSGDKVTLTLKRALTISR